MVNFKVFYFWSRLDGALLNPAEVTLVLRMSERTHHYPVLFHESNNLPSLRGVDGLS